MAGEIISVVEHPISGKEAAPGDRSARPTGPKNGIVYVRNIAQALGAARSRIAADYKARAAAYIKELQAFDAWNYRDDGRSSGEAPRHLLFSRFAGDREGDGMTLISIYGWTNKSEPSAAEVSRLAQQIGQEHVRDLFRNNITDPRIVERIARETGAAIGGTSMAMRCRGRVVRPTPIFACCATTWPAQGRYAEKLTLLMVARRRAKAVEKATQLRYTSVGERSGRFSL